MTIQEYFAQPDTPMEHSPIGEQMVRVLKKFPELAFGDVYLKAKSFLDRAAASKGYHTPRVLTEAEEAAQKEQLRAFAASRKAA